MTNNISKVALIACIIAAIIASIGLFLTYEPMETTTAMAAEQTYEFDNSTINDTKFPEFIYRNEGYDNLAEWWDALKEKRSSFIGMTEQTISELDGYLTDEDKELLQSYEDKIVKASNFTKLNENETLFNTIVERASAEKVEAETQIQIAEQNAGYGSNTGYSDYAAAVSSGNYSGSYYDFLRDGVVNSNGNKFTYYSESVLPGGGLNIPGRNTSGGFVRDANGYICLAGEIHNGQDIIDTPWGPGKIYDTGTYGNHYDVYVE